MPQLKWTDLSIKDKIQYITAVILIMSGIILAYLSFIITYGIGAGVLTYVSEAFITGGAIFGVSVYFKDNLNEAQLQLQKTITNAVNNAINKT